MLTGFPLPVFIFGYISILSLCVCRTDQAVEVFVLINIKWMPWSCNFTSENKKMSQLLLQLFSSSYFAVMQNVRWCTSCPVQTLLWLFDFYVFSSIFCFSLLLISLLCVLLSLLLAIWVNKDPACGSGRKGWRACAGLRTAGLGSLLPLGLVLSGAIVGHVFVTDAGP